MKNQDLLECVEALLPTPIAFDPNLDAPEDHFFPTTEIDSQLNDVAVLELERLALLVWLAQADVVEKGTRRALDILDVPVPILAP